MGSLKSQSDIFIAPINHQHIIKSNHSVLLGCPNEGSITPINPKHDQSLISWPGFTQGLVNPWMILPDFSIENTKAIT